MRTPAAILLAGLLFWSLTPAAPRAQAADPCLEPAETLSANLQGLSQAANLARREGRYADSAAYRCEILRFLVRAQGPSGRLTLNAQADYAIALSVIDYERGLAMFRMVLATSAQALGQSDPNTIKYQSDFARMLRVRDLWTEAETWARTAHRYALERATPTDQATRDEMLLLEETIVSLALVLDGQRRFDEGAALWQRQYEILVQLGESPTRRGDARNNRSVNFTRRGLHDQALVEAEAAYALVSQGGNEPAIMAVRTVLGAALARVGRREEGLAHMLAYLSYVERRFGPETEESCGILGGIGAALLEMRRVQEGLQYKRRALACQQARSIGPRSRDVATQATDLAAVLLLEGQSDEAFAMADLAYSIRLELPSEPSSSYSAKRAENMALNNAAAIYLRAAHAQIAVNPARAPALHARIFEAIQLRGQSETTAAMNFGHAFVSARDSGLSEAVAEWRAAEAELGDIDRRFAIAAASGRGGDGDRLGLAEQRERAMQRKAASEATLREQFPAFFEMASPQSTSLVEAQALLGADEALFIIAPGDTSLPEGIRTGLVLAVTREGVAFAQLGYSLEELRTEIAAVHGMLVSNGQTRAPGVGGATSLLSGARAYDRARAHRLYNAFFGDPRIARLAAGKSRWTVAAQGIALSAPFAALVMEPPTPGSDNFDPAVLRATRWLGLERMLAITPSVSTLRVQRVTQAPAAPEQAWSFFGVGDPVFRGAAGDERALEMRAFFQDRAANVDAIRNLPQLPGTGAEIRELARALGASESDYVLGVAATETELARRSSQLARAQIVAFATHGLIAGDLNGTLAEPALALTPPAQPSAEDDGLLTASEAARLRLRARWVILSACNTASGGEPGADGLTGLARAFFYAGARTLLVSQWPVDDQAARLLTTRAVTAQRDRGLSSAESMRQAMASLAADTSRDAERRSFAHPSAWAPFLLVSGE